jgi:hypothetical protein
MDKPKKELEEYPNYLHKLPESRVNNSLIDCTLYLIDTNPDTGISLKFEPYMPSCGMEMAQFYTDFCDKCRDPDEVKWNEDNTGTGCKFIIEATAEDKRPEPWVIKDGKACCLSFR